MRCKETFLGMNIKITQFREKRTQRPEECKNTNTIEYFRSSLNTNSIENSKMTTEAVRMIKFELTGQMFMELEVNKNELELTDPQTIDSAIVVNVLPQLQYSLGTLEKGVENNKRPSVRWTTHEC